MTVWGAIAGGAVGAVVLASGLRIAQELGWTRMDIPLLLGTIFTEDRRRANALGYLLHFANGIVFALAYFAVFEAVGRAGWLLGSGSGPSTQSSSEKASRTSSCRPSIRAWGRRGATPRRRPSSSRRASCSRTTGRTRSR